MSVADGFPPLRALFLLAEVSQLPVKVTKSTFDFGFAVTYWGDLSAQLHSALTTGTCV